MPGNGFTTGCPPLHGLAVIVALLPACSTPPPSEAVVKTWHMVSRSTGETPSRPGSPSLPEGLLDPACTPPCVAERWRSDAGEEMWFIRQGSKARLLGPQRDLSLQLTWRHLGDTVSTCIGDPLEIPPARDPGGVRIMLERDGALRWALRLGGQNDCGLDGILLLDAIGDSVNASGLRVDGQDWNQGGREAARFRLHVHIRDHIRLQWTTLPADQRILGLEQLVQDPDPAAEVLLQELLGLDPSSAPDIENAIRRRKARSTEAPH